MPALSCLLACCAILMAWPGSASAMIIGMQDDQVTVCKLRNRDMALQQFVAMKGNNVRINVMHHPGNTSGLIACSQEVPLSAYDEAVKAVRDAGLTPQLTLTWYGQDDPDLIAEWAGQMAAHFAPVVDKYSVLNEPDLSLPAADSCDPETIKYLISTGVLNTTYVQKNVKKFFTYKQKIRRRGKVFTVRRYVMVRKRVTHVFNGRSYRIRKKVRKFRIVKRPVAVVATNNLTSENEEISVRQGCLKVMRGRKYQSIFSLAEPAIRKADPGATVLIGETSPMAGLELFIGQVSSRSADGWAHHCYQWDTTPEKPAGGFGIGDTARVAGMVRPLPVYLTECGYPNPLSKWTHSAGTFTADNRPGIVSRAYQTARAHGAKEMTWFGWFNPAPGWPGSWNTALLQDDDGSLSPEYLTLQNLLNSW